MKRFITADGSVTFHSEKYDEHYHTKSGAKEESFKKYAEPCMIKELARKGNAVILDFCFGLGYNTAAALDVALAENPGCAIEIWALENDDEMLQELLDVQGPFDSYPLIQKMLNNRAANGHDYEFTEGKLRMRLLLGDAQQTMKELPSRHFDAIFFDPFSPPKNPGLWTVEVFNEMKRAIKQEGVLATYSCARSVRDAMKAAGFIVKDGPIIGRRSPSTLCFCKERNL